MKIAYFSDNFYPELSGITDTILITGAELHKRGHQVLYVGPRYSEADYAVAKRAFPKTAAEDSLDGMPFVRLPSFPLPFSPTGQSRFALPFGDSFPALAKFDPDVIHTQSPYSVGREAYKASRRFKVPLVGTNHTAIEDFFPAGGVMRSFDAWYYNHCQYVTTPYAKLLERMREKGFRRPGQALANPALVDDFTPPSAAQKSEIRRALGLAGPVLLYTGRLGVEKRVDVILRALPVLVQKFPDLVLLMTGHGAAEATLRSLAQELGVGGNVRFMGFLDRADLVRVYQAADLFVFMSTSDSQSISLMQAYASGVPAICAAARGLPDYTPKECGILVPPGDFGALAAHAESLLQDPSLRATMGAAAVQYVKQFAPATVAQLWEKIYSDAISSFRDQKTLRTDLEKK